MKFDRSKIQVRPLAERESKSSIEKIAANPDAAPAPFTGDVSVLTRLAGRIIEARENDRSVIIAYGAHLIKNGLGPVLRRMIEQGFVTHLATNGAGTIHDWEFSFQGRSEEDVSRYAREGQFGIWEETGRYLNLALILGAAQGKGYGESIGDMICADKLTIPDADDLRAGLMAQLKEPGRTLENAGGLFDLLAFMEKMKLQRGDVAIPHPFKRYSVLAAARSAGVPLTIHPGFGYDIIYTHPFNFGAAIGRTADVDWLRYVNSVANLEGGVYMSIGSAVMSPMIFEKALSLARNIARQDRLRIADFMLVVNDIQRSGDWKWGSGAEPPKHNPAYYLRFCKTFDRMGASEMHYICADNRNFLTNVYAQLQAMTGGR
ncbi:MAG: hypothetical protein ACOY90_14910 [Candidatus Zhuqueibacterota bacterium]